MRLLLCIVLASVVANAQQRTQLFGSVLDATGGALSDAAITVLNLDTGIRRTTRSNPQGVWAVYSLQPGEYKVTVRKVGFRTLARVGVRLGATETARLDFLLELGPVQETVTVEGAPVLTNTNDATALIVLGRDAFATLPLNGRGLQGVLDLAPGVVLTPATAGEAGQFSAAGQRPNTNYFTVDGVGANTGVSGAGLPGLFSGGTLPGMTAIGSLHSMAAARDLEEVRVQTSTFAPEFGRMPGAQVAFITRSGSNDFHGDVSAAVRHEVLNANDWFANRAGIGRLPQRFTEAGGAVGGPVVRDRTFFYASAEMLRLRHASVWRMAAPEGRIREAHALLAGFPVPEGPVLGGGAAEHTASAAWPARVSTTSGRIDHALGTSGTLFVRGVFTPSRSDLGYLQTDRSRFRTSAVTVGAIHAISPALTHDLRVNISRSSVSTVWTPNTPAGAHPFDPASILPPPPEPGDAFYAVSIPGFGQLVSGAAGAARQMQWNLVQTLAWTRGRHQFRAGLDYQRVSPSRETPVLGVAGEYSSLAVLLAGRGPAVHFTLADSGSSLIETFSLFAQDTWQWTPRLTLTYGTRWELTPAPSYRGRVTQGEFADPVLGADLPPGTQGQLFATPLWPTRATQFAPRAGLAWRANSEGTLVVRAGAGLFYDLGFPSSMDPLNGAPYNRWRLSVGTVPPTTTVLYGFAPELRLPYSLEWNFTVDRVWRSDTLVSAGYVGSAGRRLLRREGSFAERAGEARILAATNHGASNYHALQLQARRRVARGLRGVASYTWSHSIDNGSWDSASFLLAPGASDRGSSNFDVRHVFQGALTYDLPKLPHWTLSGFFRARTGFPIDVVSDDNVFGLGFDNAWRPDLAGGEPLWLPGRRLNPAAFRPPQRGEQGSLGRNAITGNGLAQVDLALERRFALARESVLTLRVETYNLLNRAHLADPLRFMGHPLFGEPLSQANLMLGRGRPASGLSPALQPGGQRTMQVGIRWQF